MTETLFSLEIHVESVQNLRLPCKLPALCFRLLDFPTMIIHHVPPLRAEKLRQKLLLEDRETMLDELKDRFGHFQFQKGKSCLFKASIDTLQAQLQTVPLYSMLMDLWPKKPALVGSTLIPLKEAVNKISADVDQKGLEVPSFYKSEDEFTVYNLMGSGIATVKLGFRLLSLGSSLIPHIPRDVLSTKTTKNHEIGGKNESFTENVTDFHAIQPGRKSNELEEGIARKIVGNKSDGKMVQDRQRESGKYDTGVQTNILAVDINSCGTGDQDKQKSEDDFVITNIFCPPPLYYNCNAAPHSQSAPVVLGKCIPQSGSGSTAQTLHKKDKMSDVDFLYYDPGLAQGDGTMKVVSASVQTDDKFTTFEADQTHLDVTQGLKKLENFTSEGRLPVLNALLQELSCLSGGHQSSHNTEHKSANGHPQSMALRQTHATETKKYDSQAKTKSLFAEKGSKLKKQGTKKFPSSSAQTSVIGLSRHKVHFKQTNLTYGMTKTQKMRLALNQKDKTEKKTRPCDDQVEIGVTNENIKGDSKHKPLRKAELERTYRIGPSKRFALREVKQTADVEIQTQSSLEQLTHENGPTQRYGTNTEDDSTKEDSNDPSLVERNAKSPNSLEVFIPQLEGEPDEQSDQEEDWATDEHPVGLPINGLYGHTGILYPEYDEIRADSALTNNTEDFEDSKAQDMSASPHLASKNTVEIDGWRQRSNLDRLSAHSENSSVSSTQPVKSSHSPVKSKSVRSKAEIEETERADPKMTPVSHQEDSVSENHESLKETGSHSTSDEHAGSYTDDFHSVGSELENVSSDTEYVDSIDTNQQAVLDLPPAVNNLGYTY